MIVVIDCGSGNINSIVKALKVASAGKSEIIVSSAINDLKKADKIVLPGVGVFHRCYDALNKQGLIETLSEEVLFKKKPFLGICLGMQILSKEGVEFKWSKGLGWFDASVVELDKDECGKQKLKIPHYGWNEVVYCKDSYLFKEIPDRSLFYFVHSYYMECRISKDIIATCNYGYDIPVAVQKDNIFACQFHPEKSARNGLKLLANFCHWSPR